MIKNRLKLIIKLLIAIVLLVYLVEYVNYRLIISAIKHSNKFLILIVFLLSFVNIYFQFLKWELVCNSLLEIFDKKKIWLSLFYGFSGGIVTPIRFGEYVGRMLPFDNVGLLKVTISTMIEKFTSLFMVLFFGGISAIIFLNIYFSFKYSFPFIIFVFLLVVSLIMILNGSVLFRKIIRFLQKKFSLFEKFFVEIKYVKQLGKNNLEKLIWYSLLFYFTYTLQFALLVLAFNNGGSILQTFWAGTMVMFAKSFFSFISFGDLGIRESASVLVLNKLGFAKAIGFNSAIFLFIFNLVLPSFIGLILLLRKNK